MLLKSFFIAFLILLSNLNLRADEGMWIPMLLKKYNIEDMQKLGFKLTAEDIYNINQASLKDAVVGLGREGYPFSHFCTGEIVSKEGLIFTNHHCAFGFIQAHSNLENNYIKNGFWAKTKEEELANPGLTASILVRMEDVTEKILSELKDKMSTEEKQERIKKISKRLEDKAVKGTNLKANIKPFFNGNQYFMSIYKIYKDVRLVGAPTESIGGFGGDTDNWIWPRHTGDFSVLRIYANQDNEPAAYSKDNKPYTPAYSFKVSTKGVKEGDFTMVFGYPGTTKQYIPSFAVEESVNIDYPHKINIRTAKLNVINAAMEKEEILRIKYSAKAANIANAWKKWQGEIKGLSRFKTISKKQKLEEQFITWSQNKPAYKNLVEDYKQLYKERENLILTMAYIDEAGKGGAEIFKWSASILTKLKDKKQTKDIKELQKELQTSADKFYKDYDSSTDKAIFLEMLKQYIKLDSKLSPEIIRKLNKKTIKKYTNDMYTKSIFATQEKFNAFIKTISLETIATIEQDLAIQFYNSVDSLFTADIKPLLPEINARTTALNKKWMKALMEMQPNKTFFADANSTLRVAYGKIGGYTAKDAIYYKHNTTLTGIIEKDNPNIYDYDIPQKLREIYTNKDFGKYAVNNDIPVCFVANNHTTGGNSGSPILNSEGHLIGINFDRAWDGVMSDIQFDPNICRNIAVDIRYVLFIIDKVAGANHLIKEMELN